MVKYALPGGVLCILYILHTSFCPKPVRSDVLINMARDVVAGLTDPVEFVLRCLLIIYLTLDVVFTIVKLLRFVPLYDKMLDQNFSNVEYYQVSWVRRVVYPVMLVIALLFAYLTIPGQTVSLVLGASHLLVLAIVLFLTVDSALSME